ncbi:MAG: alpha/beta fold hydrolase [Myxococcota bacterium]
MTEKATVVMLHGLARTHRSLAGLERFLKAHGFDTWSHTYPSRRLSIAELADSVAERIEAELPGRPLVAVTHSMGGILVRHMAERLPWRGVLMLAPPNAGSRVADGLKSNPVFRWYFGPAAQDVARADTWPAPPTPCAVIAGTRGASVGNVPSWLLGGLGLIPKGEPHDGTVTVAETRVTPMTAFATVPASHTWIMNHPETRRLVLQFLEQGRFDGA